MLDGIGISDPSDPDPNTAAYDIFLNKTTSPVPAPADGTLVFRHILPVYVDEQGNDTVMLNALIYNFNFSILGGLVEADTSTSINYQLTQTGPTA